MASAQFLRGIGVGAAMVFVCIVSFQSPHIVHETAHRWEQYTHPRPLTHTPSALDLWRIQGKVADPQRTLGQPYDSEILNHKDEFAHQAAFHIEPNAISKRQCNAIPAWRLQDLANEAVEDGITTNPVIYHFQNGTRITDANREFDVGDEFCSVILAPQTGKKDYDSWSYRNEAIDGWGPDSIHCSISSTDIRFIPPHPDYWGSLTVASNDTTVAVKKSHLAVYTVPYVLNHPGEYQFSGEVEFQNYDWVMEDPINTVMQALQYDMLQIWLMTKSPSIRVSGIPVSRPTQKCQHDGFNDLHGRWYRASAFSASGNQTSLNPKAHLEFADHNTTIDEWGWTFAPDACSLTFFTPADHESCLADKTIQVLGDSNSRRLMKSVMGGGRTWCTNPMDRMCNCEDTWQTEIFDEEFKILNATRLADISDRDTPITFGNNSKLFFDFAGGLLNAKLFNPWTLFYDVPSEGQMSIIAKRAATYGAADVVHVSFLGWDIAGIKTPDQVLASLPTFRNTLLAAYPPGTRFIHRLANSMCCGNINVHARYSPPRFKMWNAMWKEFWADDEARGRVRFDDPSVLQGRRDAEVINSCPTTHLRGSHVRLEQMMWMGSTCDKDATGKVTMRDWGYDAQDLKMLGPGINELKNKDVHEHESEIFNKTKKAVNE